MVVDVQKTEVLTKRGTVGIVSRIFDTIAIMLPATIKLHKAKIEWNSSFEGEPVMKKFFKCKKVGTRKK